MRQVIETLLCGFSKVIVYAVSVGMHQNLVSSDCNEPILQSEMRPSGPVLQEA